MLTHDFHKVDPQFSSTPPSPEAEEESGKIVLIFLLGKHLFALIRVKDAIIFMIAGVSNSSVFLSRFLPIVLVADNSYDVG
jgi:hypothetical protein